MSDSPRPKRWPYRADIPQRYNDNAALYVARGGKVRLEEDVSVYVADGNFGDISRFYTFCLIQDQIHKEGLPGDVAELGVYRGNTASLLATIARRKRATAWLFDTFEGFRAEDLTGIDADKKLEQFTDTSLEAVQARIGTDSVRYMQGYFPQTTVDLPDDVRFCLVHIDCDLYEPITSGLNYFYPRLVPGGFLVMHDYTSLAWNGAERAIDEFFADKPESVMPLPDGAGSAVIRRARDPATDRHWSAPSILEPGQSLQSGDIAFARALKAGWSKPEPWGVWGTEDEHRLEFMSDGGPMTFFVDCAVYLVGPITSRMVDVSVNGKSVATWVFTTAVNRARREFQVDIADRLLEIVFRVDGVVRPSQYIMGTAEIRSLGLAMHKIGRSN